MGADRWAALGGFAFVVLYVVAFAGMDLEGAGDTDHSIRTYYASHSHRVKEVIAFFLISAAALSLMVFANGLRRRIASVEPNPTLAPLAWGGAIACVALILAGNVISRTTAFAVDKHFTLDPNTRRMFETAGFLMYVAAAYAAILLVATVAIAALRHGALPRWLGWVSAPIAVLLITAIAFLGFLIFLIWVLAASAALVRGAPSTALEPG